MSEKQETLDGATIIDNRTIGNAAAMREALKKVMESAEEIMERVRYKDGLAFNIANYIAGIAQSALSLPPRNCDRFETAEDAKKEFNYLWNFVWKRGGGYVDEREYRSEYEKWLFAPIREGETDGSK